MATTTKEIKCPLMRRNICCGECYDIQAVRHGGISPKVLKYKVDTRRVKLLCSECKFNPLPHPKEIKPKEIPQKIKTLIEQDVQARGVVITEGMTYQNYFLENESEMSPEVVEQITKLDKIYTEYMEERKALGLEHPN
jgi:hypothetical protein